MQYIQNLSEYKDQQVHLKGWVANKRSGKGIFFIILRDGSGYVQCIASADNLNDEVMNKAEQLTLESSCEIIGKVVEDERQVGGFELQVEDIILHQITQDYPITKKEHGVEFLMDQRHLWLRSTKQWAIMRIRNRIIFAIHEFFQGKGFVQMDSPIFTENAAEGSTTLFSTEYYGQPAYLAQTGQLYGEAMAMAQGLIYTFGPTFRAEKSKTRRHLSEFWMIEPEMAFYDNDKNMDLIEEFVRFVVLKVLDDCNEHLNTLGRDTTQLQKVSEKFPRITYDDAVEILKGSQEVNGKSAVDLLNQELESAKSRIAEIQTEIAEREAKINDSNIKKGERNFNRNKVDQLKNEIKDQEELERNIPQWMESAANFEYGNDLGGSDETILTKMFDQPVMVYNWPKDIKAFYMKRVDDNDNLVKGVDLLAPEGYGEIVGGSEREDNLEILLKQIEEHKLPVDAFEWYIDLRKYGSVPHAGFGLGLARVVSWICGLTHIREAIPFPRYYGRLRP